MPSRSYKLSKEVQTKSKKGKMWRFLHWPINRLFFVGLTVVLIGTIAGIYVYFYEEIHALYPVSGDKAIGETEEIKPTGKVYIKFSQPVSEEELKNNFTISPTIEGEIGFTDKFIGGYASGAYFKPSQFFTPDQKYKIKIGQLKSFYGTEYFDYEKEIKTVQSARITESYPKDGEEGVPINPELHLKLDDESEFFEFEYRLDPEVELEISKKEAGEIILRPKKELQQGTEYHLIVDEYFVPTADNGSKTKTPYKTHDYKFKTIEPVKIESVEPTDGDNAVPSYGEIKIKFNRNVNYESAEGKVIIEPEIEGTFGWEEQALIFAPEKLEGGKEYKVTVKSGIKGFDDGFLEEDYTFSFKVKKFSSEVIPTEAIEPKITEGKYIDIDISDQILTIFNDGKSYGSFRTSTGKYSMPTPYGTFKILNKSPLAYSSKYDLYMPYWMAFTGAGHGLHELPFWKYRGGAEYKERESHLGTRVSHGCVRMGVGPAETVYKFADIGTPVVIHE